jgi:hypothetical protein
MNPRFIYSHQYTIAHFTGESQLHKGALIPSELNSGLNRQRPLHQQEVTPEVVTPRGVSGEADQSQGHASAHDWQGPKIFVNAKRL